MFRIPYPSPSRPKRYVVTATICATCRKAVLNPTYWHVAMINGIPVGDVYCDAECSLAAHQQRSLAMAEP